MSVLDRNDKHKIVGATTAIALCLAAAVYIGLLCIEAANLANGHRLPASEHISLGPLPLSTLSKTPVAGGYQVTLQLLPGMWIYAGGWLIAGLAVSYLRVRFWRALLAASPKSQKSHPT